jgi:hypothetical protein
MTTAPGRLALADERLSTHQITERPAGTVVHLVKKLGLASGGASPGGGI